LRDPKAWLSFVRYSGQPLTGPTIAAIVRSKKNRLKNESTAIALDDCVAWSEFFRQGGPVGATEDPPGLSVGQEEHVEYLATVLADRYRRKISPCPSTVSSSKKMVTAEQ
jgi:hypothetical protein